ncbi:hypothetical protein PIIN_11647 [Serendipita indica DSM 11827]|uniref:Uncharacterized protein n=1 Tax=Serendipita indica (strain DSM 11827) TaxID=1109443 RepID=G4U276_SERID|nr:hypothetical protein PIIN_11647 [Serendipita indica DSM 11827]
MNRPMLFLALLTLLPRQCSYTYRSKLLALGTAWHLLHVFQGRVLVSTSLKRFFKGRGNF